MRNKVKRHDDYVQLAVVLASMIPLFKTEVCLDYRDGFQRVKMTIGIPISRDIGYRYVSWFVSSENLHLDITSTESSDPLMLFYRDKAEFITWYCGNRLIGPVPTNPISMIQREGGMVIQLAAYLAKRIDGMTSIVSHDKNSGPIVSIDIMAHGARFTTHVKAGDLFVALDGSYDSFDQYSRDDFFRSKDVKGELCSCPMIFTKILQHHHK